VRKDASLALKKALTIIATTTRFRKTGENVEE
jgi:hypothetical protein